MKNFTTKSTSIYKRLKNSSRPVRSDLPHLWQSRKIILNSRFRPNEYILCHGSSSRNFGDAINRLVMGTIAERKPILPLLQLFNHLGPTYAAIGSTLQFEMNPSTEIWGAGFLRDSARFEQLPKTIHAVRGPLTRHRCLKLGIACPPIYGDPAVFYFDYLKSTIKTSKKYTIGIIPHYSDRQHPSVQKFANQENVKLIDVYNRTEIVARQVMSCEYIVSSSLHGLILADALEIPSRWLGVSPYALQGGFKFQDYFASVHRHEPAPLNINRLTIANVIKEAHLRIEPFSRDNLFEACPFKATNTLSYKKLNFEKTARWLYSNGYFRSETYWGPVQTNLDDWRDLTH